MTLLIAVMEARTHADMLYQSVCVSSRRTSAIGSFTASSILTATSSKHKEQAVNSWDGITTKVKEEKREIHMGRTKVRPKTRANTNWTLKTRKRKEK